MNNVDALFKTQAVNNLVILEPNKGLVYFKNQEIGQGVGNNGQVFMGEIGYNTQNAKRCAVKKFPIPQFNDQLKNKLYLELALGKGLKHKNIATFYECEISNANYYIFMEFCAQGSLAKMIEISEDSFDTKKIPENQALDIMSQIIDALYYMKHVIIENKQGYCHRDLKPDNILFQNGVPKLIDFGMGRALKLTQKGITHFKGSPIYMSPENLKEESYDLEKNDIWSIGIILFQLVEGQFPWRIDLTSLDDLKKAQYILTKSIQFTEASQDLQDLLCQMLQYDENQRISLQGVIQHKVFLPYFKKYFIDIIKFDTLYQNYFEMKKLTQQFQLIDIENIITDITLYKMNSFNIINKNSEQDIKRNTIYQERILSQRKSITFSTQIDLKNELKEILKKNAQQRIIDKDQQNLQEFLQLCQMILSVFFEDNSIQSIEKDEQKLEFLAKQ